jgi:hypothetical protein
MHNLPTMEATPYVNPAHNGEAPPSHRSGQRRGKSSALIQRLEHDPVTTEPFTGEAPVPVIAGLYGPADDKSTTGARRGL